MKLVSIATFNNISTAYIYLSKLESQGIPCYIEGEYHHYRKYRGLGNEGIKLVINDFDVERAKLVLETDSNSILDPHKEEKPRCPHCGSSDNIIPPISISRPGQFLYTIFMMLIGFVFVTPKAYRRCSNCGRTFKG